MNKQTVWPWLKIAAIVLLCGLLAIMVYLLIQDIAFYRSSGVMAPRHHPRELLNLIAPGNRRLPPAKPTIDGVQAWMTFDFLNRTFGLPPTYLKSRLAIVDPQYPNLSIRRYASSAKKDLNPFLIEVKNALRAFPPATSTRP